MYDPDPSLDPVVVAGRFWWCEVGEEAVGLACDGPGECVVGAGADRGTDPEGQGSAKGDGASFGAVLGDHGPPEAPVDLAQRLDGDP